MKKRNKLLFLITLTIAVVIVALCTVSYFNFGSLNFFKSFSAVYDVNTGRAEYRQISQNIVLATAKDGYAAFEKYITAQGYEFEADKQLGGLYVVSKNGKEEKVYFSVTRYYSKFEWE